MLNSCSSMVEETNRSNSPLIPAIFTECFLRASGLGIYVGNRNNEKSKMIMSLMLELSKKKTGRALVFESGMGTGLEEKFKTEGDLDRQLNFTFSNLNQLSALSQNQILDSMDVIIFDGLPPADNFQKVVNIAERGSLVIVVFAASSLVNALRQIYCALPVNSYQHYLARFAEVFFGGVGQTRIGGGPGGDIYAWEVIMNQPEVRNWIEQESVEQIKQWHRNHVEKPGALSRNQSLVQLLVRRKIDFNSAFKFTDDPEHLDQLLKKIGI